MSSGFMTSLISNQPVQIGRL